MKRLLGEDAFYELAMDICESEIAALGAVGELSVIEAEEMEDGSVEVVHVNLVLHGIKAEFVGFTEFYAALGAAAGHLHGACIGLVITHLRSSSPIFSAVH